MQNYETSQVIRRANPGRSKKLDGLESVIWRLYDEAQLTVAFLADVFEVSDRKIQYVLSAERQKRKGLSA